MLARKEGAWYDDGPFRVTTERTANEDRVHVCGEIDMSVTRDLDRVMRQAEAGDAERIVLDLSELDFLDAAGVRLLLDLKERSDTNGCRLRVVGASSPHVRRVLEVTGAAEVLPILR